MNSLANLPIAVLELDDFTSGGAQTRQQFVQAFGDSFSDIGFAAIRCPLLNEGIQKQLFDELAAFFALPEQVKLQYEIPGLRGQRGYSRMGSEQAKGYDTADIKEFWHHGQTLDTNDPLYSQAQKNLNVQERINFTPTLEKIYRAMEETGSQLLQAIALYLDLEVEYFEPYIKGGISILRPIHYPPITKEPGSAVRAAAHEDINLITLLMGASAQGLEVLSKQGEWLGVLAPPEHLTINVGDMLQRLTNKRLVSTTHRVVNPPKELWSTPRYSVPFFLHPRPEMSLASLDSCVDSAHPKLFSDMTAGEYLEERLREIRVK